MLKTFFHGFTAVFSTGTLQNLMLNISSIFFHPTQLGPAIKKQVQSETQSLRSVTVCLMHEACQATVATLQAAFFAGERVMLVRHDVLLVKADASH